MPTAFPFNPPVWLRIKDSGAKLGNAGPPRSFFLDGGTKERAPKGRCQARGIWGQAPPENFAEFDLILEAFCTF